MIYTIKFQKRGLPHAHILIFLYPQFRHPHPHDIDKIISVELHDEQIEHELFKIMFTLMIHGPCGVQNKKSPCMQNGKCTKFFPKKFLENTTIDSKGYPMYRQTEG